MAIIGGMDLGFGSQVKVITTDYLVINAASSPTATSAKNFLSIVNNSVGKGASTTHGRLAAAHFDYIILDGNSSTSTDPVVIDGNGASVAVPLMGPAPGALHQQADLAAHQDDATDIGHRANGVILAILSATAGTLTVSESLETYDASANVELAGLTADDNSVLSHLQGELTAQRLLGNTLHTVNAGDVVAELNAASLSSTSLTSGVAALNADFVAEGNAAGTAATALSAVTTDNDIHGYISITALVRTAQ